MGSLWHKYINKKSTVFKTYLSNQSHQTHLKTGYGLAAAFLFTYCVRLWVLDDLDMLGKLKDWRVEMSSLKLQDDFLWLKPYLDHQNLHPTCFTFQHWLKRSDPSKNKNVTLVHSLCGFIIFTKPVKINHDDNFKEGRRKYDLMRWI